VGRPSYVLDCFVKFLPEMRLFVGVKKQSYLQLYLLTYLLHGAESFLRS